MGRVTRRQMDRKRRGQGGNLDGPKPARSQRAMGRIERRVFQTAGVLEEKPAELAARFFDKTIVLQPWQRQAGEELFVNHPFDKAGSSAAPLGDYRRAIQPGAY